MLVTGAAGFIGSHLCELLLERGADVTAMIRYTSRSSWGNLEYLPPEKKKQLRVTAGNIEDEDFVLREVKGKELIFHLAALIGIPYSYVAPRSYIRSNVEGTLNVMESSRVHQVQQVIHTSTSETYGTALYTPVDEKHPLQGQSPYSASKIGADKIAESYHLSFQLPVTTIRPFNTYGPRQSARAVIPTIISQALTEAQIKLGSLQPVRDLTYVKDTARAFVMMAESDRVVGETINIGTGNAISIGDLARTILSLMKSGKTIEQEQARVRPEWSEVQLLVCDCKKARELTGWAPQYSLEQGLTQTIEFISRSPEKYRPSTYTI